MGAGPCGIFRLKRLNLWCAGPKGEANHGCHPDAGPCQPLRSQGSMAGVDTDRVKTMANRLVA